jgi:hypothetical protein
VSIHFTWKECAVSGASPYERLKALCESGAQLPDGYEITVIPLFKYPNETQVRVAISGPNGEGLRHVYFSQRATYAGLADMQREVFGILIPNE